MAGHDCMKAASAPEKENAAREEDGADEKRIRGVAKMLLENISSGISCGGIEMTAQNIKQLTATVKDLMDILGVMTPAELEEHNAKMDKLRRDSEGDREVSVIFGEADEWCG